MGGFWYMRVAANTIKEANNFVETFDAFNIIVNDFECGSYGIVLSVTLDKFNPGDVFPKVIITPGFKGSGCRPVASQGHTSSKKEAKLLTIIENVLYDRLLYKEFRMVIAGFESDSFFWF